MCLLSTLLLHSLLPTLSTAYAVHCLHCPLTDQATKGLAAEYGPANIRVNSVAPLLSGTGLFSTFTGVPDTPANRARFVADVPLGRLTLPDDVAGVCLFLASDDAAFINGAEMLVDGGKCV